MSTRSRCATRILLVSLSLTAFGAFRPQASAAQGLTYTIVTSARWIDWDDDLDFDRSRLLGGQLNIRIGRCVGLSAFYHENGALTLFSDPAFAASESEQIQTGGAITLAFGTGTRVPVLQGGASILRFRPDDDGLDEFTKLPFDYGGGLQAVFSETISAEVMIESSEYRLPRERLSVGAVVAEEPIRHNLSLRAGVGIQLGRRTFDRASETDHALASAYDSPFDNFGVVLEPQYGRFTFDGELGFADQDASGGRVQRRAVAARPAPVQVIGARRRSAIVAPAVRAVADRPPRAGGRVTDCSIPLELHVQA